MKPALFAGLLLAAAALPAGGGDATERVPGTITLSDGTELEGPIRSTSGRALRLLEAATGRRLDLDLDRIHSLRVEVLHEEQHRVWRWVEDGSREKVYTGESYPKRDYETVVTLRDGTVLRGDMVGVLYVYPDGRQKPCKVILRKQEEGEKGETLADLVHVESVVFQGPAPSATVKSGDLRLVVSPGDLVLTTHAISRERDRVAEGVPGPEKGEYVFPGLVPGLYDLAVVTERALYLRLAVGPEGGDPLEGVDRDAVRDRVAEIPDFFEEREVLAGIRSGDRVRAVVLKGRRGRTSMGGERTFRRIEVWFLHRSGDRWLVDTRGYLWREHGAELPAAPRLRLTEGLGAVRVGTEPVTREFSIPEEDTR